MHQAPTEENFCDNITKSYNSQMGYVAQSNNMASNYSMS
jgi:hypothetical protein